VYKKRILSSDNEKTILVPLGECLSEQDGFVQRGLAKIQAYPAKMTTMMPCSISSGEGGFGE
jgi:hypothetical protein